eukprot:PhM_4_TR9230/c0_g1_i1/m.72481/K01008/selD, SEPHS; selenide, water dikinase
MDCSIVPLKHLPGKLSMVSTTDFFFPAVEDPFLQGCIGCANVLSDMYSMGITRIDTMLMLLAASSDMPENSRYIVTELLMKGFNHTAALAGAKVTGGQTVQNPSPIIGGVATSVVRECEMVRPDGLMVGDILVLTKPLGTQVAVNVKQMFRKNRAAFESFITTGKVSQTIVDDMYDLAARSMCHLNLAAAGLMSKHNAHGSTDVTGFGLLGHATNLAKAQPRPLFIEIDTLPCIANTVFLDVEVLNNKYGLLAGVSAETSGGLLVAFPDLASAEAFQRDLKDADGSQSWIVGKVLSGEGNEEEEVGQNGARLRESGICVIEVSAGDSDMKPISSAAVTVSAKPPPKRRAGGS